MFLFRNPAVPRDQRPDHLLQHPGAGRGRGGGDQHPRGERPQQRRARRRRVRRAQAVRAARGRRRQVRPGSELELESTFAKYSVTKRALTMTFSLLKVPTLLSHLRHYAMIINPQ